MRILRTWIRRLRPRHAWRGGVTFVLAAGLMSQARAGGMPSADGLLEGVVTVPFGIARMDWTRNELPTGGVELRAPDGARNAGLRLVPVQGAHWDFSAYSYFRVDLCNTGTAVLWIEGRLENEDAKDL